MNRNHVIFILILIVIVLIFYPVINKNKKIIKSLDTEVVSEDTFNKKEIDKNIKTDEIYSSRRNAITNAAGIVEPAVVSVNVIKTQIVKRRHSFFFGFYDEVPYSIQGIGSGVIFSVDGFILTNAHVVEGATEIKVILTDTRQFDAKIIGIDITHDVAVIKIEGNEMSKITRGGTSARTQASVLNLYDDARLKNPRKGKVDSDWETVDRDISAKLNNLALYLL